MNKFSAGAAVFLLLTTAVSQAADFQVSMINLTRGIYFTPLLVAAHEPNASLFSAGEPASASLQTMAEGGDIAALAADLAALNASIVENPAAGLLGPGRDASASLNTDAASANTHLSIVAMLLPTNDAFVGLNALEIPTAPGTYVFNVNAYDAGTEANDEIRGSGAPGQPGFPAPPGSPVDTGSGNNGTGISAVAETFVHIHRGVLGDSDSNGGNSDIDSAVHRWLNPVMRVVITVN